MPRRHNLIPSSPVEVKLPTGTPANATHDESVTDQPGHERKLTTQAFSFARLSPDSSRTRSSSSPGVHRRHVLLLRGRRLGIFVAARVALRRAGRLTVLPPPADAPLVQDPQGVQVFPDDPGHRQLARRAGEVGRRSTAFITSTPTASTIRTRPSTAPTEGPHALVAWCKNEPGYEPRDARPGPAPRPGQWRSSINTIMCGSSSSPRSCSAGDGRRRLAARRELAGLGRLRPHGLHLPRDVVRELRRDHVGIPQLSDRRRLAQQLVGGDPELRRGLAQQPSRLAALTTGTSGTRSM